LFLFEALHVNRHRVQTGLIVSFLLLPIPISFMLFERDEANTGTLNIAVLQPNIDPFSQKFSNLSPEEQYSILIRLADSLNTGQTDIFLGPETALHHIDEAAVEKEHSIQFFKNYLEEHAPNASFIIGGNGFRNNGRTNNTSIQTHRGIKEIHKPEKYNSAYFISAWTNTDIYHKTKLVSGVEKMPFSKILPGIDRLIMNLGGNTGSLSVCLKNIVFHTANSTIGVPICYESCYGEYLGKMAQEGARSFFIITNDGWWKGTTGYKQHLAWSRIRAIEHRRSVVRSANTGISAAIDHRGQYLEKTQWWRETGFTVNVPLYERITFYTKYGDYIGRIAVLVFLATVIIRIFYWKRIA
jgi:apolipoprotein N-acyltransferase